MTPDKKTCSGYRSAGHWKGYPCNAVAKFELDGKWYCANHYAKAVIEKEMEGDE